MKFTRGPLLLSLGFFLLSFKCFGGSFETEDSLYSKRGLGFSYATKAREAYKARLTDSLTSDEKIYVVSQMARLDIYRGAMTDGVSLEAQKKAFRDAEGAKENSFPKGLLEGKRNALSKEGIH